ncbi:hypothetical protein DEO72_LG9g1472 [Vigna unguiculata]|uniref:Secreted protein n=1 Tax=Vigna unguiculata TaxID=3917 RepID=A0A4D6MIG0_VIGUN|nr:hypothetical protein DEO72_LG7g806 [Vigna unguiculata]QCE06460.1 hypothetical protein DEO72_LG9g1472 [Vigna unguiculata]
MATTTFIHLLHLLMMNLRHHLLPQATTRGSTIYKPQPIETCARITCYRPHSVTPDEVLNTNHNSYSRHKIDNITTHNPWLFNQVETIRTSHNSHTHTGTICHFEPQQRNTTCLPSIPSHNSRDAPAKFILKVFIQSL